MEYSLKNIRKINKGFLRASFDLVVGPFTIKDYLLFEKEDKSWVQAPSRKYIDSNGDEKYFGYVRIEDKDKWESFCNWAIDGVLDKIGSKPPEVLEDDDIPF